MYLRRGLTFVELLVTIAIVATLWSTIAPVLRAGKGAMAKQQAMISLQALQMGTAAYLADNEQTYPLGVVQEEDGSLRTWFGWVSPRTEVDTTQGALSAYFDARWAKDPTAQQRPYLGNGSGFGYNFETLGSDFTATQEFTGFPLCSNAATQAEIESPSETLAFATSVYFRAPWERNGDGKAYDYGFVTPPGQWEGNPTIDFRHQGQREVDVRTKKVTQNGFTLALFADGAAKCLKQGAVRDNMFQRNSIPSSRR